jgi:hypothetical protein
VRAAVLPAFAFVLAAGLLGPAEAHAADPGSPPPPLATQDPVASSGFDVEFGGGALVPLGPMATTTSAGLDVGGRLGWSSRFGLGLVLSLDYAPLRQKAQPEGETIDAHLFAGTLEPRFTVGKSFVRLWLSAGPGVLVGRTDVHETGGASTVTVDSGITVGGQGGLDFLFFDSGGLSLAGGYKRGLAAVDRYQYVAFTAGLLFML